MSENNKINIAKFNAVKGKGVFYDKMKFCEYWTVEARIYNIKDNRSKIRISYEDIDGRSLKMDINSELVLNYPALRDELLSHGFSSNINKELFTIYAIKEHSDKSKPYYRETCYTGWVDNMDCYICPSFICSKNPNDKIILSNNLRVMGYSQKGTLEEWQANVAEYAKGNSILIFVLCAALSPVLLKLIPELGTMVFHLVGPSSIGKTTALKVAASVWGKPKDYIKTWRATGNAQECLAESHSDGLLILDEMGQASSFDIGNIVYMLGNEQGKSRMNADSSFRELKEWKEICLSSGEIKLTEKVGEGKSKVHDGMLVRLIDIDCDLQKGMGIFEFLPNDIENSCKLSGKLSVNTSNYYGVAAEEFVKYVIQKFDKENFQTTYETSLEGLKQWMIDNEGSSKGNDGKVLRVLQMFAFVYAVGIEASHDGAGILPYNTDEIDISIKQIIKRCDLRNDADKNREILKYVQETLMSSNNILPIKPFRDESSKTIELTEGRKAGYGETYGYSQEGGHYYLYGKHFGKLFCDKYGENEVKKVLNLAGVIKPYKEGGGKKKNPKFSLDGNRVSLIHLHFFGGGE